MTIWLQKNTAQRHSPMTANQWQAYRIDWMKLEQDFFTDEHTESINQTKGIVLQANTQNLKEKKIILKPNLHLANLIEETLVNNPTLRKRMSSKIMRQMWDTMKKIHGIFNLENRKEIDRKRIFADRWFVG